MHVSRVYSAIGDPYRGLTFVTASSRLAGSGGSNIFEAAQVTVPEGWTQVAIDVLAQKYFRRAGVPSATETVPEIGIPQWLWRSEPTAEATFAGETDARQVFHRLAGCWTYWGYKHGYFENEDDARAYYDEMCAMLARQLGAPNSPQFFNTGLYWAYGLESDARGQYHVDPDTGELRELTNAYTNPNVSACFISSIEDNLINKNGILDFVTREARIFRFGSGNGANFSKIRAKGEKLSGGGTSSGLMSFLKLPDVAAGAIKSGGTTRRSAKMVILDLDHPEIREFITWKVREERKVAALVAGSIALEKHLNAILKSVSDPSVPADHRTDPAVNKTLQNAIRNALRAGIPQQSVRQTIDLAAQGVTSLDVETFTTDWEGEAYGTVSGQNSNNSVRIPNRFFSALEKDQKWQMTARTTGDVVAEVPARELWNDIGLAAWQCADPGLQFDDTINEWHTHSSLGRINGTNPCAEYAAADDTSCNLASINLVGFLNDDGSFDVTRFEHAARLWTLTLELSVLCGSFPDPTVAKNTYAVRNLGLGYASLGSLLMRMSLPYDSEDGFTTCAAITALLTGVAYRTSAEMAQRVGPFPNFKQDRNAMLRVLRNHARAAGAAIAGDYEGLTIKPITHNATLQTAPIWIAAQAAWQDAVGKAEQFGVRNAQASVAAPTGTISLLMSCDTTGIEPDFALVKFKKLAGGGYFKIVNESVTPALQRLGYSKEQIADIQTFARGTLSLNEAPHINRGTLRAKGLSETELDAIETALPGAFSLSFAFTPKTLGESLARLTNLPASDPSLWNINVLRNTFGFTQTQIDEAADVICGRLSLEGAPHIKDEHLPIFDCATPCGPHGSRYIRPLAHIDMMAAAQPFFSGAISKSINMPQSATIADVQQAYEYAWKRMIKAIAIYRDGSKLSQPLSGSMIPDDGALGEETEFNTPLQIAEKVIYRYIAKKRSLPARRSGYTQKVTIGAHKVFLKTGEYRDGSLGEIFIDMHKEGAALRAMMNNFAIAVSMGLQHGVPLEEYVEKFTFTKFEPNGVVQGHDHVKMSSSIMDFIFRDLGITYLGRYDLAHVQPSTDLDTTESEPEYVGELAGESHPVQPARDLHPRNGHVSLNGNGAVHAAAAVVTTHDGAGAVQSDPVAQRAVAIASGFTGDACGECGQFTLVRSGTCTRCVGCSWSSGCS
jgi:ribonucleoside-diphosphate reductase alpha chain